MFTTFRGFFLKKTPIILFFGGSIKLFLELELELELERTYVERNVDRN